MNAGPGPWAWRARAWSAAGGGCGVTSECDCRVSCDHGEHRLLTSDSPLARAAAELSYLRIGVYGMYRDV
jgi:hypothetical protein